MAYPNPRLWIPIVVVTVLGVGGWYIEVQRARERSTMSGFFESQPTYLSSRIGGRVARILVQEGEDVNVGQPLIELETKAAHAQTEAARAQAQQAEERLREVVAGPRIEEIRRQEAVVAELSATLMRLRNGPLPEEIEAARARLRRTQAEYRKLRAGLRPQEIESAQAAERQAAARLAQAERGPTAEERAQLKARLEGSLAKERLAREDLDRAQQLYREGAISKQVLDNATANYDAAWANRKADEEAYRRAELGTPREELEQAREAHRQAKAALDLALAGYRKEDIAAARAEVAEAEANLRLLLRGTRREDIRATEARLRQAQETLAALRRGSRPEEIAQVRAAAAAARLTARASADNLKERVIFAAKAGRIERILVAVGDLVAPGSTAVRLADPNDIWLRVYIPEADLAKVHVGDDATLAIDGIAELVTAYVESIATQGEFTPANLQTPKERGKQVFGVRLRLKQPDPRVKAGMYATVKRMGQWP